MNGKRDMRKKFVKSSRPTYKKRIRKAQQGMRFVNYNVVENPTIDYKDITNPTNPFSEYNFNTTYNTPQGLVVPTREDSKPDTVEETPVIANNPTVEPVVNKPVTNKATYTPKAYKGLAEFNKAYDEVEKSNPEAKKYRQFLTKMAEQESGFNSAIQNRAGAPAYGYFQFMQDDKKYNNIRQYAGTDIETFRSNPKLQIEAAIKLAKSFEKGFSKEDLELAKKNGYSTWGLLGGAWLAGNGGVRKFLQGKGNPSDRHWSKEGKGTDVAARIKAFNFKEGGIIKYQNPAQPIARRDAVKDYRPAIPLSPIKQSVKPYMPTQQPMLSQDNRTGWDKEVSKQIKADKAKNDNLYNSQHVWNWSAPFTNARVTKGNASAMFDFDKSATMSTFAIGTGIANPVATATSMAGSLVGAGIGNKVAGEKGALIGGFVGGMVGNRLPTEIANNHKIGFISKLFQNNVMNNTSTIVIRQPKTSPYIEIGKAIEPKSKSRLEHINVDSPMFGDYIDKGSQQAVFNNAANPNQVLKVLIDRKFTSVPEIKEFHKQWMKRNRLPLQERITFEGYLQGDGRIYPVYSQNRISTLGNILPKEWEKVHLPKLNKEMNKLGYKNNEGVYTNGKLTVGDISPDNVGYVNGNIRFVDADVYKKGGKLPTSW